MTVPGLVQSSLEGAEISARVSLGGDDELFITPSSTLIYRAEGLLSDESIEEFPHDADKLTLSEGRRKTRFTLSYALEGTREFTIPASRTDDVLHPVVAGVLNGNGVTEPGETVLQTFRFSELTLIVTSNRLVKHIGAAVWDEDFEQFHFGDVTNLSFEDGAVARQIVLEVDGRQQRIKAPNERADEVCERLKRALCSFHDVATLEAFNALFEAEDGEEAAGGIDFGAGVAPLETGSSASSEEATESEDTDDLLTMDGSFGLGSDREGDRTDDGGGEPAKTTTQAATKSATKETDEREASEASEADEQSGEPSEEPHPTSEFEGSGFQQARPINPALLERLEALEATVEAQTEQLASQQATIEQLIEELRRGR